jgi:hypothetical protein
MCCRLHQFSEAWPTRNCALINVNSRLRSATLKKPSLRLWTLWLYFFAASSRSSFVEKKRPGHFPTSFDHDDRVKTEGGYFGLSICVSRWLVSLTSPPHRTDMSDTGGASSCSFRYAAARLRGSVRPTGTPWTRRLCDFLYAGSVQCLPTASPDNRRRCFFRNSSCASGLAELSRRCIASRWGTRITVAHNPSVSTARIIVVTRRRTLTTLRRRRGTLLAQRGGPRSRLMLRLRRTGGTLWSQLVLRTRNVLRTRVRRM